MAEEKERKRPVADRPPGAESPRKVPKLEIRHFEKMLTVDEAKAITAGFQVQKKVVQDEKKE